MLCSIVTFREHEGKESVQSSQLSSSLHHKVQCYYGALLTSCFISGSDHLMWERGGVSSTCQTLTGHRSRSDNQLTRRQERNRFIYCTCAIVHLPRDAARLLSHRHRGDPQFIIRLIVDSVECEISLWPAFNVWSVTQRHQDAVVKLRCKDGILDRDAVMASQNSNGKLMDRVIGLGRRHCVGQSSHLSFFLHSIMQPLLITLH